MKNIKFDEVNDYFNSLISNSDLEETKTLIDNESILSRIYKKINGSIDNDILGLLILYNIHIKNEQYESAEKIKQIIIIKI